jgi:hypothetical protein
MFRITLAFNPHMSIGCIAVLSTSPDFYGLHFRYILWSMIVRLFKELGPGCESRFSTGMVKGINFIIRYGSTFHSIHFVHRKPLPAAFNFHYGRFLFFINQPKKWTPKIYMHLRYQCFFQAADKSLSAWKHPTQMFLLR